MDDGKGNRASGAELEPVTKRGVSGLGAARFEARSLADARLAPGHTLSSVSHFDGRLGNQLPRSWFGIKLDAGDHVVDGRHEISMRRTIRQAAQHQVDLAYGHRKTGLLEAYSRPFDLDAELAGRGITCLIPI